jgi:preprotein translocase subunit SecD
MTVSVGFPQDSVQSAGCPAANARSLANGVYAVLREHAARPGIRTGERPHIVLIYDRKYSEADEHRPPKYVELDASCFVPLVLAGPPDTHKDDRGWTQLNIKLARRHVKTLEEFTRAHLGGVVATVIDGEIITMHKVRSVIEDGEVKITRCSDNACETLLLKLAK